MAPGQEDPLLSICIPTYNMGRWLGGAVASAIGVGAPDEVEILVVDNCSSDDTPEVLREFDDVPNLRVLREHEHLAMVGNFNRAARSSRGSWITMLSADDELLPSYYRNVREHLARTDLAAVSQTAMTCWEDRQTSFGSAAPDTVELEELVMSMGSGVCMATTAVRRDLFDAVGGFSSAAGFMFDVDLFVRVVLTSGLPIHALGVDGGRYYPLRGSSWQRLEDTGEATALRRRWIELRRPDLGPDLARAAERTVGRLARYNGMAQLGRGARGVARQEFAVSLRYTCGRDRWKARAGLLASRLPDRAVEQLTRVRARV